MSLICVYDTETTGFPLWKDPSDHPDQPHIVELAALLVDTDSREVVGKFHDLIRPDGWAWTNDSEAFAVHGITMEHALEFGIGERDALQQFRDLHDRAELRVGFNESFDARICRIGFKRYFPIEVAEAFKAAPKSCAMWEARPICQIPHSGNRKGLKLPKLSEACDFFGIVHEGAHSALGDATATNAVWWAIQDHLAALPAVDSSAPIPLGL